MGVLLRTLLIVLVFSGLAISHAEAERYLLLPPPGLSQPHGSSQIFVVSESDSLLPANSSFIPIANVVIADLSEGDVAQLKELGWEIVKDYNVSLSPYRIESIESFFLSNNSSGTSYWNLEWIGADKVWKLGINGSGVKVAVIDTGVALHPDLKGRIAAWKDFVNNRPAPYDDNGHGTHVAGIVAGKKTGVAPGAELLVAKVFDRSGVAPLSRILAALQWAVDSGADVISYSAGIIHVDRFTGTGVVGSNNTTAHHKFQVAPYKAEKAFKPAAVVVYLSSDYPDTLNITLRSPDGEIVHMDDMGWLKPGDNTWYFVVGKNYLAKKFTSSAPLPSGNWSLELTFHPNETVNSFAYTYTILVIYQSDGTSILDRAVERVVRNGTVFVGAAGNDGLLGYRTVNTPATSKSAIAVGATSYKSDQIAYFSSEGPVGFGNLSVKPDVVSPGEKITSTFYSPFWGYGYATMSGTSMAVPHVSGVVALMLQANRNLTPLEVLDVLKRTSVDLGVKGEDYVYGWGRISALSAVLEVMNAVNLSVPIMLFAGIVDQAFVNETVRVVAVSWNMHPVENVSVEFTVEFNGSIIYNVTKETDSFGVATFDFVPVRAGKYRITLKDEFGNVIFRNIDVNRKVKLIIIPNYYRALVNKTMYLEIPILYANFTPFNGSAELSIENSSFTAYRTSVNVSDGIARVSIDLDNVSFDDSGWYGELFVRISGEKFYAGKISITLDPYSLRLIPWGVVKSDPGKNLTFVIQAFDSLTLKPLNIGEVNVTVTWVYDDVYEEIDSVPTENPGTLSGIQSVVSTTTLIRVPLSDGIGTFTISVPENAHYGIIETRTSEVVVDVNTPMVWNSSVSGDGSIYEADALWECGDVCNVTVYAELVKDSTPLKNETVFYYTLEENGVVKTNEYGVAEITLENVSGSIDVLLLHNAGWQAFESDPDVCSGVTLVSNYSGLNINARRDLFFQITKFSGIGSHTFLHSGFMPANSSANLNVSFGEYVLRTYDGLSVCEERILVSPLTVTVDDLNGTITVTADRVEGLLFVTILQNGESTVKIFNGSSATLRFDRHGGPLKYFVGISGKNISLAFDSGTLWVEHVLGDVNGDGLVTSVDAEFLAEMILGLRSPVQSGDVNFNGRVDVSDLVEVLYYLWGIFDWL